ncbi:MAG: phosphotransferase [Acidimicrobiales bacterium]
MIGPGALAEVLPGYLGRQRWFAGDAPERVDVVASEVLKPDLPGLVWLLVEAEGVRYQLVLGLRAEDDAGALAPAGDHGLLGALETDAGRALVVDALTDPAMAIALLELMAGGLDPVEGARPVGAEQSNSSVVFDDRLIMKLFRRVTGGTNPEVEVTTALARVGFAHVAEPLAVWHKDGLDRAVVQRFLAGGAEGFASALTSLRDLYANACDPADCGGDFAAEAERLGAMTAAMHLALAEAFGSEPGQPAEWAATVEHQVAQAAPLPGMAAAAAAAIVERLRGLADAGRAVRVHGDYHLAQVMRTDAGWFVLDFEGEPARPLGERVRPTAPAKDVAGMLRSFHYAAEVARLEREQDEREALETLAGAWERRNRDAFLAGYLGTEGIGGLLPLDMASQQVLIDAFELGKAAYELTYERAHRPQWVPIPEAALARLLGGRSA